MKSIKDMTDKQFDDWFGSCLREYLDEEVKEENQNSKGVTSESSSKAIAERLLAIANSRR